MATDHDFQAELNALNAEINTLTEQIKAGRFYSLEHRTNTHARLDSLISQADVLEWDAEVQNQHLAGLADGIRAVGDWDLGVVAYLVYGTAGLRGADIW